MSTRGCARIRFGKSQPVPTRIPHQVSQAKLEWVVILTYALFSILSVKREKGKCICLFSHKTKKKSRPSNRFS